MLADSTLDMVLEDFEDGLLSVPGIVANPIENEDGFPPLPFVNDGRGIVAGPVSCPNVLRYRCLIDTI